MIGRLLIAIFAAAFVHPIASAQDGPSGSAVVLTGRAAYGDFRTDAPGVRRHIGPNDLSEPFETETPRNRVRVVDRPTDGRLNVPPGFAVKLFARGLDQPRLMRVAPNGDIFVAESQSGQVRVLRPT